MRFRDGPAAGRRLRHVWTQPSGVMGRLTRRGSHPGASFARASEGGTRKEKYHQHQLDLHVQR